MSKYNTSKILKRHTAKLFKKHVSVTSKKEKKNADNEIKRRLFNIKSLKHSLYSVIKNVQLLCYL